MHHFTESKNDNRSSINIGSQGKHLATVYYPFILIILGTLLNFFTFYILCRRRFRDANSRPTIYYMRATALFDVIMLYGWNFDHFLRDAHDFTFIRYSVPTCKIFTFINYFALQVSAWLRVLICLDRYLSLSRLGRTYFNHSKHVIITIGCLMMVFILINGHILLFACFYRPDSTVDLNARLYTLYPLWDYVNLGLFNCIPFLLMVIFNSGVIYYLIQLRQTTTVQVSRIQYHSMSITLVITTFLFLIMTTPATVGFAFFQEKAPMRLLRVFDHVMYTYHVLSFPLYMVTFIEFRREVFLFLRIRKPNTVLPRR